MKNVTLRLSDTEIAQFDRLAKEHNTTQAKLLRRKITETTLKPNSLQRVTLAIRNALMVRLLFSKLSRQLLLLFALLRRKQTYPSNSCTTLSIPSDLLMTLELDPHEQQARADYIEYLYRLSGRTNRLYTGLYQARVKELIARDRYAAVNTNHPAHEIEPPPPPPPLSL